MSDEVDVRLEKWIEALPKFQKLFENLDRYLATVAPEVYDVEGRRVSVVESTKGDEHPMFESTPVNVITGGHCRDCRHWTRTTAPNYFRNRGAWGECTVGAENYTDHNDFVDAGMMASSLESSALLHTRSDFGCTEFAPKEAAE